MKNNSVESTHYLIDRLCAVCGSNDTSEEYSQPIGSIAGIGDIGYNQIIQICKDCGFVFASPVIDEASIKSYYENFSNYEKPQFSGVKPEVELVQSTRIFDFVKEIFDADFEGNVTDIGCAVAYCLSLFKNKGWSVIGMDPSEECANLSKKMYDVNVERGFFDPQILRKYPRFDLIIFSHVFEHLYNPEEVVRQLQELMNDGGVVYIEVPNLQKPWGIKSYFSFEHVNYFTPTSLANLMTSNGFRIEKIELFDNESGTYPGYPVISSAWKKSDSSELGPNNFAEGYSIIDRYRKESTDMMDNIRKIIDDALKDVSAERIALWGGGIHSSQILEETSLGEIGIRCIFDNDSKKHGTNLGEIPVIGFDGDGEGLKSLIDVIIISSEASEEEIYEQIRFLEEFGVKIVRLYG